MGCSLKGSTRYCNYDIEMYWLFITSHTQLTFFNKAIWSPEVYCLQEASLDSLLENQLGHWPKSIHSISTQKGRSWAYFSWLWGEGGGVNQAYSRLSTTHGHITNCKLDSVVYAGVCVWVNVDLSCLDWTIYARQFCSAKPPIQFRHTWAERNYSDHLYWLRATQLVA